MQIGFVKEIKEFENRVALVPSQVRSLTLMGAKVIFEKGAGQASNIPDQMYIDAGARMLPSASNIWQEADLIVKVKEPLPSEYKLFKPGQALFTFLHLAAEPALTKELLKKKVTAIAFETVLERGSLPILKPMSEIAGRMAVQVGAYCLEKKHGGKGILLGGVPGVRKGRVLILGAGTVGKNAAMMAVGLNADVTVLDISALKLEEIDNTFSGRVKTLFSNEHSIKRELLRCDLVIGAVLVAGAKAPKLITKNMIGSMEKGSAIIDIAIDQGGCIEGIRKTTHENPTYLESGVVHYGVANMPGAVCQTSTTALSHAINPYLANIVKLGLFSAIKSSDALKSGLNTFDGMCTHSQVADSLKLPYKDPNEIFLLRDS